MKIKEFKSISTQEWKSIPFCKTYDSFYDHHKIKLKWIKVISRSRRMLTIKVCRIVASSVVKSEINERKWQFNW